MLLVVIIMFYNVLWESFIESPYFGYNSTEQENPVLRIFKFQGHSRTQIDLRFFYHEKHQEKKKSMRRGPLDDRNQGRRRNIKHRGCSSEEGKHCWSRPGCFSTLSDVNTIITAMKEGVVHL
jgi:hypothetical protein